MTAPESEPGVMPEATTIEPASATEVDRMPTDIVPPASEAAPHHEVSQEEVLAAEQAAVDAEAERGEEEEPEADEETDEESAEAEEADERVHVLEARELRAALQADVFPEPRVYDFGDALAVAGAEIHSAWD